MAPEGIIDETVEGMVQRNVYIIFSAQKVSPCEIATQGGLTQPAKTLGYLDARELLVQILSGKKAADEMPTQIAENDISTIRQAVKPFRKGLQ